MIIPVTGYKGVSSHCVGECEGAATMSQDSSPWYLHKSNKCWVLYSVAYAIQSYWLLQALAAGLLGLLHPPPESVLLDSPVMENLK